MTNVEEILDNLREAIQEELESTDLSDWLLNATGTNLKELLGKITIQELQELTNEIEEGLPISLEIDLSDPLLAELEQMLDEAQKMDLVDDDEEDY